MIVKDTSKWTEMDGKNSFEQKVNSLMTYSLIGHSDVPSDECVSYARKFSKMKKINYKSVLNTLKSCFSHEEEKNLAKLAIQICDLYRKEKV